MAASGIVFAATGPRYVNLARRAARTVRLHMPEAEIDLFTGPDFPSDPVFNTIHTLSEKTKRPKMEALQRSRFERTLYLDADVVMVCPVPEVFDLLDRFDLVGVLDQFGSAPVALSEAASTVPLAFRQINSGVLGIRKTAQTSAFLAHWQQTFNERNAMLDQPLLRELLFDCDLRVWILPNEYNHMYPPFIRVATPMHMAPRLLHLTHLHEDPVHSDTPERPFDLSEVLPAPAFEGLERLLQSDRTLGNPPLLRHAAGERLRQVPWLYRFARRMDRVIKAVRG